MACHFGRTIDWVDTKQGRVDALATMTLLQMLADAYESARKFQQRDGGSENEAGGSRFPKFNEAQLGIERWLVHTEFLPPTEEMISSARARVRKRQIEADSKSHTSAPATPRWRQVLDNISASPRKVLSISPKTLLRKLRKQKSKDVASTPTREKRGSLKGPRKRSATSLPSRSTSAPASSVATLVPQLPPYTPRPRFEYRKPIKSEELSDPAVEDVPSKCSRILPDATSPRQLEEPASSQMATTYVAPALLRSKSMPNFDRELIDTHPWHFPQEKHDLEPCVDKHKLASLQDDRPSASITTLLIITLGGYILFALLLLACVVVGIVNLFSSSSEDD